MENKENICSKCGKSYVCEKHHILPRKLFGEGETDFLCPNCHAEYHRYLGNKYLQEKNKQSIEFYYHKYYKWSYGAGLIVLFLYTYFK